MWKTMVYLDYSYKILLRNNHWLQFGKNCGNIMTVNWLYHHPKSVTSIYHISQGIDQNKHSTNAPLHIPNCHKSIQCWCKWGAWGITPIPNPPMGPTPCLLSTNFKKPHKGCKFFHRLIHSTIIYMRASTRLEESMIHIQLATPQCQQAPFIVVTLSTTIVIAPPVTCNLHPVPIPVTCHL